MDGDINIIDATNIQRILAGFSYLTFKGEKLSDVNQNGDTDILDATLIQRYIADLSCPQGIGEATAVRSITYSSGYAQPFVQMNDANDISYRNKGSDIIRIVVYVETDYDTDLDGKPDLVKAWVQIPRAAAEGDYQAPALFEANPYSTSANKTSFPDVDEAIDEELLSHTPDKRVPNGIAPTEKLAADFRYSDVSDYGYGDYIHYNYFLCRGFAIVGSSGLGTRGSEGLELCGTAMEADAYKAIVEWIHGDRKAYSNRTDNLEVKADWSNGKTGMLGVSYMGTLAYEVAATGVEGLEAIIPIAGIASWYDYINQQGSPIYSFFEYSTYLSGICASRFFDGIDDENAYNTYLGWRRYIKNTQSELRANYGHVWDVRDFSQSDKIKASTLIIQGLSDDNVRPKHYRLMVEACERSGAVVKSVLHQGGHSSPGNSYWTMKIGTYENYLWLANRWFSHYLLGCNNGAESIPNYIIQSNTDGNFYTYDKWESGNSFNFDINDGTGLVQIQKHNTRYWSMDISEATTIKGTVEVHLRLKADHLDFSKTAVKVSLIDSSSWYFDSYCGDMNESSVASTLMYDQAADRWASIFKFLPNRVTRMNFTHGQVDIATPNAGWEPQTSVAPETPVKANEWHDYTIYLEPEVYTLQPGHTLYLTIEPQFENFSGGSDRDASITLDQSACYAVIPTDQKSTVPYSR